MAELPALPRLDHHSVVPLYSQLLELLQERITSGAWPAGTLLPSEAEIGAMAQVSRTVVRQAMDALERAGLVRRQRGVGAHVAERKVMAYLLQNSRGFAANMAEQGFAVSTRVLSWGLVAAGTRMAQALDLPRGTEVWRIERLRLIRRAEVAAGPFDGDPVFLGETYLPAELGAGLSVTDLADNPLNGLLAERHGLLPSGGDRVVEGGVAGSREAELLAQPIGAPLLRLFAVTRDQYGRPMEVSLVWLRADRIAFSVTLT